MPQLRRWYISDSSNFISPNCHILHRLPQPALAMFAHLMHYIKGGQKWTPKNCNVCKPVCSFWQLVWSGHDDQNWITIIIIFAQFCPFCPFQDRDRKSGKDIQSDFPKLLFVKIQARWQNVSMVKFVWLFPTVCFRIRKTFNPTFRNYFLSRYIPSKMTACQYG